MWLRSIDPSSDRSGIRNHSRGELVRASDEEGLGFPEKGILETERGSYPSAHPLRGTLSQNLY